MKRIVMVGLALVLILGISSLGTGAGWGPPHKAALKVGTGQDYATISAALAAAVDGDTIMVFRGTYDETIKVEGKNGLTIKGTGKNDVILKPSTTLPWNVGNYGTSRQTVIRVVNSTNVELENLTIDCDMVKGNLVHGILYWDSTGSVNENVLKNLSVPDASGGYYEIGSYFRAPSYTDAARADIKIFRNTFIDVGRVGIVTHDFVNATITGNIFYKTNADFGYAVEMGSESSGSINFNTIYGYNTAAASDGSNSAGIYVENCFTAGDAPAVTKNVFVTGNNIYNCQWAFYAGNEFTGYAGDVDVVLSLYNNYFHDNTDGGAVFTDEDKESGSSLTINGGGNVLTDNGGYGYYIYTQGDGDIKINLKGEKISGHDTGVYAEDTSSASSSTYSVAINQSDINDNSSFGINNTVTSFMVDATKNWWGDASGPLHPTLNPKGTGDTVSDYVTFNPWLKRAIKSWPSFHKPSHWRHTVKPWLHRFHRPER